MELIGAHWWKKDAPPSLTVNAQSEEAAEKPTTRHSLRALRCLMPVRRWYEWNEHEQVTNDSARKVKQPFFIDRMSVGLKPEHFNAWMEKNTYNQTVKEIITDSHIDFISYSVNSTLNVEEPQKSRYTPFSKP